MKHLVLFLFIFFSATAIFHTIDVVENSDIIVAADEGTYKPDVGAPTDTVGAGSRG